MFDVAIVGGGIAGVSLAASLAADARVILIEAEPVLAHHASGRSAALYEPRYGKPAVVELSLASGTAFGALPGVLSPRGIMVVADRSQRAAFEADADAMQMDRLTVDEAVARVPILNPDAVAHAALADHAWDIDTDLLLQGYARAARSAGAQIRTGARVTSATRAGGAWRLAWPGGGAEAQILVNAAGAWVDGVAEMAGAAPLGFAPMRRSMARIPAPGAHDPSGWPMVFGAGEGWYMKPDAGALIVSPAEEHPMPPQDAWADDMVLAEGLARYEAMVTTPVTRMLANWAGLRTFAPDRVPVIGFDRAVAGFFWLAGQGGYGFQTAPAAARLAADLLAGRATELSADLVAALSPARFA
ncbi:MAG: FAD-binding oxidoreductase [Paracoccaceae bacterium]|nr:MAG: FAD-binding oxidoreductase [Paracoccaceae bacterium]